MANHYTPQFYKYETVLILKGTIGYNISMEKVEISLGRFSDPSQDCSEWRDLSNLKERWFKDWYAIGAVCDQIDSRFTSTEIEINYNGFSPAGIALSHESFRTAFPMKGISFGSIPKIVIPIRNGKELTSLGYRALNSSKSRRLVVAPTHGAVGSSDKSTHLYLYAKNSQCDISSMVEISRPNSLLGRSIYLNEEIITQGETARFRGRVKGYYDHVGNENLEAWAKEGYKEHWETLTALDDPEMFYSPVERAFSLLNLMLPLFKKNK